MSLYHHTLNANHLHGLWEIPAIICGKSNIEHSIMFADSLLICFIVAEFILIDLNTPILKVWDSTSQAQHPLITSIVRQQFPSVRASRDVTKEVACQMALTSSTILIVQADNTNIHEVKLKMSCYNHD